MVGISPQGRRERLYNGNEFLRKLLRFAHEFDDGYERKDWLDEGGAEVVEGDEEDDEQDVHPSAWRRNPFIADQCELAKRGNVADDDDRPSRLSHMKSLTR